MSIAAVKTAVAACNSFITSHKESFSDEGYYTLLIIGGLCASHLRRGNVDGFDKVLDDYLAGSPDAADYYMDDLFQRLGITDRYQLSNLLLVP